ncbi:MAG TPA: polysaccharide biosynthesis/export family protein [Novosphingobium sp.]|nr:polysaccharide biosynthesis/export family protein [Novosphingobium sp.]
MGLLGLSLLSGCYGTHNSALPHGPAAYQVAPSVEDGQARSAVQAGDRLAVRVLGEPDLTSDQVWVDGNGRIQLPLAGEMQAGGLTPEVVRDEIARRLSARYVRNPQVAVTIIEHAKQAITVEGEVQQAGLFEAPPGLTLLGALALAHSTTRDAALDEVVIFRTVEGRRMAARFNIAEIRVGKAADPQVLAGDVVVVGRSAIKSVWHDFLQAAPAFSVYYWLK